MKIDEDEMNNLRATSSKTTPNTDDHHNSIDETYNYKKLYFLCKIYIHISQLILAISGEHIRVCT